MRPPKTPLTQTIIESPGSIRLTTAASMPAEPVPLTASVIWFLVRNTLRSMRCMSFMICKIVGIEMPDSRLAQRLQHARVNVAGAGAHEDANWRIEDRRYGIGGRHEFGFLE